MDVCSCLGAGCPHQPGSNTACMYYRTVVTEDSEGVRVAEPLVVDVDPLRPHLKEIQHMSREDMIREIVTANMGLLEALDIRTLKINIIALRRAAYDKALTATAGLEDGDGGQLFGVPMPTQPGF